MDIRVDDLSGPEIRELLEEHLANMQENLAAGEHACAADRGITPAGDYVLDGVGERRAAGMRGAKGARRGAWRDQVDADRFATFAERGGESSPRSHDQ